MERLSLLRNRKLLVGVVGVVVFLALGFGQTALERSAEAQAEGLTWGPMFEVDPLWPKPLPNHWVIGATIGVAVDERDHVWIVHRASTLNAGEIEASADPQVAVDCCVAAPPVLEFDQAGNLVGYWGGPGEGYEWPKSNHGIAVDHKSNVWIGGNGGADSHVLKFTRDGTFIKSFGVFGARQVGESDGRPVFERDSHDQESFGRVAKIGIDAEANEAYFADGYFNKRIAVVDMDSGEMKRYWGAYGNPPDDSVDLGRYSPDEAEPATQFRGPVHCSEISNDGLVYVCDRAADRIQVFQKDGTYVTEYIIAPATMSQGSTWDIDFSPDEEQTFLYLADGQNMKVYIILRETMEVLTAFGDGGRQPGMFFAVHSIAVDSDGNIYTTETYEGSRIQKFVYKGMGNIPEAAQGTNSQGVLWPSQ